MNVVDGGALDEGLLVGVTVNVYVPAVVGMLLTEIVAVPVDEDVAGAAAIGGRERYGSDGGEGVGRNRERGASRGERSGGCR